MTLRLTLPGLALAGILFALWFAIVRADASPPAPVQLGLPPTSPYAHALSGAGVVEAASRNIAVAAALPGVVAEVPVTVGERVAAGAPLFRLDDRDARAQLAVQEQAVAAAAARVGEAESALADLGDQLSRGEHLRPGVSITGDQLERRRFAVRTAAARLAAAKAEHALAEAQRTAARVTLERLTVRAPIGGSVMQVNIRPGEYVLPGGAGDPPLLLGSARPFHLRVSIDEVDAWRFRPGAAATAFLRGDNGTAFPLRFVGVEPYVVPKRSLTGNSAERVDTRVLELVYALPDDNRTAPMIYAGQQLDVFIEDGGASPPQ